MLSLPLPVRIYLCTSPVDLRKSFDGLAQSVREFLGVDPLSGHLFCFRNKRGDRLKLLYWERGGYTIIYKRLELGVFRFPASSGDDHGVEIRAADLTMILDGVDLDSVKRQKRYERPPPATATPSPPPEITAPEGSTARLLVN
jgi:transposase